MIARRIFRLLLPAVLLALSTQIGQADSISDAAEQTQSSSSNSKASISEANCKKAAAYSEQYRGVTFLVIQNGKTIFEQYANGANADKYYELASGTKSFSGLIALAAQEDGIISLDEPMANTITEWKNKENLKDITVRQLLNLVSGIKTGIGNPPPYAESINAETAAPPGKLFQYGATPFQIFGEFMNRKLKKESVEKYARRRILDPAGIHIGTWRKGRDGQTLMPQGAQLTARNWSRLGLLVLNHGSIDGKKILSPQDVSILFKGTSANPMYGLTWWLNRPMNESLRENIRQLTMSADLKYGTPGVPNDLVMAAGAGKQRLYVIPSLNLVVVRQADKIIEAMLNHDRTGFSDNAFIQLLTTGKADQKFIEAAENKTHSASQDPNARKERMMKFLDANHDGKIDDSEKQKFRDIIRQRMQDRRAGGAGQ